MEVKVRQTYLVALVPLFGHSTILVSNVRGKKVATTCEVSKSDVYVAQYMLVSQVLASRHHHATIRNRKFNGVSILEARVLLCEFRILATPINEGNI